jgi:hypothetical protein
VLLLRRFEAAAAEDGGGLQVQTFFANNSDSAPAQGL